MVRRTYKGATGGMGKAHRQGFRFHLVKLFRADITLYRQVMAAWL